MNVFKRFVIGMSLIGVILVSAASQAVSPSIPQSLPTEPHELAPGGQMVLPLLVVVDLRGQIRDIQHSTYLPPELNNLLWSSVRSWIKSPAKVDGRYATAQVLMSVVLHADATGNGQTNAYFTLASNGPVMRGYWLMRNDQLIGACTLTGDYTRGDGGTGQRCAMKMVRTPAGNVSLQPAAQPL